MPEIRGITVSVGPWYADLLRITLPRNMRHMNKCVVITAPGDPSILVASEVPGVRVFETDAFTRHGAVFNKGLAVEEGFGFLGREGWLWVWDADIVFPDTIPFGLLRPNCIHGMRRRILNDPGAWSPSLDWRSLPRWPDGGPIGFCQIANADVEPLKSRRPWYDVSFPHAGGCDAAFMELWPRERWRTLPTDCLHLGPTDSNWFSTSEEGRNMMAKFVTENGWTRAAAKFTAEQISRAGELPGRVHVPGYPLSKYELPFVKQAQQSRQNQG